MRSTSATNVAGNTKLVSILLEAKANVHGKANGATPLWLACQQGHEACLPILVQAGADVNATAAQKATLLHVASQQGRPQRCPQAHDMM